MELVYLWVKKYKNIEEQGFNFSPQFHCEYNEKENKLTINKNDDYIPDFFGKNINVTAIVGKNGSGKSSLLMQEFYSLEDIEIVFDNDTLYIPRGNYKNTLDIINNTNYPLVSNTKVTKVDIKRIYFNWDVLKPIFWNDYLLLKAYNNPNILLPLLKDEGNFDLYYFYRQVIKRIILIYDKYPFHTSSFRLSSILVNMTKDEEKLRNFIEKFENPKQIEILISHLLKYKYEIISFDDFIGSKYFNKTYISQLIDEGLLHVKFFNEQKVNLFDLSHGELSIFLSIFLIFENALEKDNNLIIYLDEPDLTLHPQWQKEYINQLIKIFMSFDKKVHFIITSHSPFLISDLPRENIIFLENGKQFNGLKEKKQTFGANIHTLLSDSFFMEDGLMGEFAKSKIDDVINYLHDRASKIKSDDEAQKLIHIIGEPIVKNQLQRMLDSKRLKKVDEIEVIKKSMESMQRRLDELEYKTPKKGGKQS